jgi:hypothetical protein
MNREEYQNVAPTRPDRVRRRDLESFKALASIESREVLSEEKVADGLFLRTTHVVEETFDFYYEDQNVTYRFNVRAIKNAIVDQKIPFAMFRATITEKWYGLICKHGGIEEERVAKVSDVNRPGLVVIWPEENSLIIDGNHRLVARYRRGLRFFRYAAIAFDDIRPYTLWRTGRSEIVNGTV